MYSMLPHRLSLYMYCYQWFRQLLLFKLLIEFYWAVAVLMRIEVLEADHSWYTNLIRRVPPEKEVVLRYQL